MPGKPLHNKWTSNGKLMISGEYLVLAGARALAMPVSYRQTLHVAQRPSPEPALDWSTKIKGKLWLQARFSLRDLKPSGRSCESLHFVKQLLKAARELNPGFLNGQYHWEAVSDIGFDREWGLGSSSSLISNIAWWANVDPYGLFFKVSGGSGYDIACARSSHPVLYHYQGAHTPPVVETARFNPVFADQVVFVYSGRKQSSEKSLRTFDPSVVRIEDIRQISALSGKMAVTQSLPEFMEAMEQHERITADYLHRTPLQADFFPDFPGSVKSLGAWGGDFFMAAADRTQEEIIRYFHHKGYHTVIPFTEMRFRPDKTPDK